MAHAEARTEQHIGFLLDHQPSEIALMVLLWSSRGAVMSINAANELIILGSGLRTCYAPVPCRSAWCRRTTTLVCVRHRSRADDFLSGLSRKIYPRTSLSAKTLLLCRWRPVRVWSAARTELT